MEFLKHHLSGKQEDILEFIPKFIEEYGYPPTVREIQFGCNISSTSVVDYNLQILQRENLLRRTPETSRSIELLGPLGTRVDRTKNFVPIPLVGNIAAGEPIPVFTDASIAESMEILEIPSFLIHSNRPTYALRVKGISMIDALIADGDIVLIETIGDAQNGDMVVAWLSKEKEATLKRFYREGDRVRLQPANPLMEPIFVRNDEIEIQGKVTGVIRSI